VPRTGPSPQTAAVLVALAAGTADWRHGYDLARETGLKSGTLYPILIRLAERGLVQARWEDEQPAGRPRRHLYRLTAGGLATARELPAPRPAAPGTRAASGSKAVPGNAAPPGRPAVAT
jgi:PadR family transcriptional regulator, regulatory protein PadR